MLQYFKMLKIGMPMDVVKHAMKRDEKDPTIMDLDHNKSLQSQRKEQADVDRSADDGPALKDDPVYEKVRQASNPLSCPRPTVSYNCASSVFQDASHGTADGRREACNETR